MLWLEFLRPTAVTAIRQHSVSGSTALQTTSLAGFGPGAGRDPSTLPRAVLVGGAKARGVDTVQCRVLGPVCNRPIPLDARKASCPPLNRDGRSRARLVESRRRGAGATAPDRRADAREPDLPDRGLRRPFGTGRTDGRRLARRSRDHPALGDLRTGNRDAARPATARTRRGGGRLSRDAMCGRSTIRAPGRPCRSTATLARGRPRAGARALTGRRVR